MATTGKSTKQARQASCANCALRQLPAFRPFEPKELDYVATFKRGELKVDRGATILAEGNHSAHLYTVLSGWGFRYKLLSDGRRQILNYAMPGDLLGLQSGLIGEMQHSVESLTPMTLCLFERERLGELYREQPGLAFDITWLAAREEQMLDENLLSIGRRTAIERASYLIAFLSARTRSVMAIKGKIVLPLKQQHVADTLGLSLVHTNKTLRKLASRKLAVWREGRCEVLDPEGLAAVARWEGLPSSKRPLL